MIIHQQFAAHPHQALALILLSAAIASGCGEASSPDVPPLESFGTDGSNGGGTGDGNADAGLDETTGEHDPEPGQCLIEDIVGLVGERYQCKGQFQAFFGADGVEESSYPVSFGYQSSGDSYEKPFVNACCGPLVDMPSCPDGDVNQHLWACYIDSMQQMCVGVGTKVEELRNSVPPAQAFIKPSLAQLRDWLNLATSIAECSSTFILDTGLVSFDCTEDPSLLLEDVTWTFSETEHGLIQNPYLRIGHVEIVDVDKPDVGEPCTNLHDNDGYIPLQTEPEQPGWTKLALAGGTVSLRGPQLDGTAITGSAGLASIATGCQGKECSSLTANLQAGPSQWRLEGLQLHSVGAASAGDGDASIEVQEYTVSLFSPAEGTVDGNTYEIPAGAATFSLSGRTAFGSYSLATTNKTELVLQATPDGWVMSPFEITYVDHTGHDWTLIIDASAWAPRPPQ